MKKPILSILSATVFALSCFGQNSLLVGKTFVGEVSSVCKSFIDGGCLVTTYHMLTFSQDSVFVNYYTKANCDTDRRNAFYENNTGQVGAYSYQKHKKRNSNNYIIRINGYEIGSFEAFPDKLVEFRNGTNYSEKEKVVLEIQN